MKDFIEIFSNPFVAFVIWQIFIAIYMYLVDKRLTKIEDYLSDIYLMVFTLYSIHGAEISEKFKIKDCKDITFNLIDENGKVLKSFKNNTTTEVDSDKD